MPFEPFIKEEASQVRMALEADPEQVKDLPFQPVGVLPKRGEGADAKVVLGQSGFEPKPSPPDQGEEGIGHLQTPFPGQVVNAGQVQEHGVIEGFQFQAGGAFGQKVPIDIKYIVLGKVRRRPQLSREAGL
jgi:hypothetical protein